MVAPNEKPFTGQKMLLELINCRPNYVKKVRNIAQTRHSIFEQHNFHCQRFTLHQKKKKKHAALGWLTLGLNELGKKNNTIYKS